MNEQSPEQIPNVQKQRIYKFATFRGYSRRGFEAICGLGNGFFKSPGAPMGKTLRCIFDTFPELNPDYVLNGITPMELPTRRRLSEIDDDYDTPEVSGVPTPTDTTPTVAEPTRPYTPVSATINVPASILDDLRDQLKKKDQQLENAAAQIATLQLQISELLSKL